MRKHAARLLCALIALLLFPAAARAETDVCTDESGFLYVISEGAATVTGFGGEQDPRILNVPGTLGGHPVRAIAGEAFRGRETLFYVRLPETVETIGDLAFADCPALAVVTLPGSLREIGAEAFSGCVSLTMLTVPEKTESIGEDAFAGCSPKLVLNLQEGSPLEAYALRYGIGYTFLRPC